MLNKLLVTSPNFTPIFFQSGVNIILGKKDYSGETYNSVGKTLLLRLIDYLLGSTENPFSRFSELQQESVVGAFSFGCGELEISRSLKNPNLKLEILNSTIPDLKKGESIHPNGWREWLKTQYWADAKDGRFRTYSNILNKFSSIENFNGALKSFHTDDGTTTGKRLAYLLNLSASTVIYDNDFTFTQNDKRVLNKISAALGKSFLQTPKETLERLDALTLECDEAFQALNSRMISFEKNQRLLRTLKSRLGELKSFEPTNFNRKFSIYKKELGDYLKKNYEEAFTFHVSVVEENKVLIRKRIEEIEKEIETSSKDIGLLETKTREISEKISSYATRSLGDATAESYLLGRFLSQQDVSKVVTQAENTLSEKHNTEVQALLKVDSEKIDGYRDFLRDVYRQLFSAPEGDVAFDVSYSRQNVFKVELSLPNDSGEGIGSLKSLMFLFLLVYINAKRRGLDYMLIDSACVDSIDKDVFTRFLKLANFYAQEAKFQFICAINEQNVNIQEISEIYKAKVLTPQNNLFGMQLTPVSTTEQQ